MVINSFLCPLPSPFHRAFTSPNSWQLLFLGKIDRLTDSQDSIKSESRLIVGGKVTLFELCSELNYSLCYIQPWIVTSLIVSLRTQHRSWIVTNNYSKINWDRIVFKTIDASVAHLETLFISNFQKLIINLKGSFICELSKTVCLCVWSADGAILAWFAQY